MADGGKTIAEHFAALAEAVCPGIDPNVYFALPIDMRREMAMDMLADLIASGLMDGTVEPANG